MPEAGGFADQAAITVVAIEVVLGIWGKMEAARMQREREKWNSR